MKTYGDFPEIIREVIKIRVGSKYNHGTKSTANTIGYGFEWEDSPEGYNFWDEILRQERNKVFFDKYPLTFPCGIDTKGIAKMDFIHKGNPIKQGRVVNANKFTWPYLCEYDIYMKQFNTSLSEQENNPFNIDYSKSDWWKILEEGDEVIVVEKSGGGEDWPRLELGLVISVTQKNVEKIFCGSTKILFNNNEHCANFTYNMVKLHKKKNKQSHNFNTHDLSTDSGTIEQSIRTGRISIPSGKCQIATSSRLVGATKSIVPSPPTIKNGVLSSVQLIKHY